jgi:AcrR family transcriptional regulator
VSSDKTPEAEGRARSFWSGYDVMWGVTPETVPRRGTGLDRVTIVRAAIAIADADGMDAVTMRRVAERLGTGPMSLYRYVPDKDALVSMMVDEVIGGSPGPAERGNLPAAWREALRAVAEVIWTVCQDHPWYAEAIMVRPPLTPNGAAGLELCLSIFDGYELDIATKMLFVGMVQNAVITAALNNALEGRDRERLDMTEEEVMDEGAPFIKVMLESGRYPRVADFIVSAEHVSEKEEVMRNVELILDGIAARLG